MKFDKNFIVFLFIKKKICLVYIANQSTFIGCLCLAVWGKNRTSDSLAISEPTQSGSALVTSITYMPKEYFLWRKNVLANKIWVIDVWFPISLVKLTYYFSILSFIYPKYYKISQKSLSFFLPQFISWY